MVSKDLVVIVLINELDLKSMFWAIQKDFNKISVDPASLIFKNGIELILPLL